jgi:hypothetical protein
MNFDAFSGICSLDTATSRAKMLIPTPGVSWYGATDGPSADTFYAVGNPSYFPDVGSELFLIDMTTPTWTVNSIGFIEAPAGGDPIREIGMADGGTLFGTDYRYLYTIPTTPGGGTATFKGAFGADPNTGDEIDCVFSLDYDTSVGQLVGTSWRRGPDQTDLYYFDRTNGAGTLVGYTGIDRFSDVWYSNNSGTLLGASRTRTLPGVSPIPGRIFDVDAVSGTPTSGQATQIGTTPGVSFFGLANATPATPAPLPYVTAPLTDLGYVTHVLGDLDALVDISGGDSQFASPPPFEEHGADGPATGDVDVLASVLDPQSGNQPWQNTNGTATIGLSDAPSITDGMLRVSSTMTATATGSDDGVAGVTRHSSVYGYAEIEGAIGVGTPVGNAESVLFGASVYTWGDGLDLLTWNLTITNYDTGFVYLDVDETSDPWYFSFEVDTGEKLRYLFIYDGLLFETPSGTYELNADVDFGAAGVVPEPATVLLLCGGAISLVLKKRRRGK